MSTIEIRMKFAAQIAGEMRNVGDVVKVPRKLGLDLIGRGDAEHVQVVKRAVLQRPINGRY
jgi:hypothetical protein